MTEIDPSEAEPGKESAVGQSEPRPAAPDSRTVDGARTHALDTPGRTAASRGTAALVR